MLRVRRREWHQDLPDRAAAPGGDRMSSELARPAELFKLADQFDERQIANIDGLRDVLLQTPSQR
jgi:hypothetical protein